MIVVYLASANPLPAHLIRFNLNHLECVSISSAALSKGDFGPSTSVWMVPGTAEE